MLEILNPEPNLGKLKYGITYKFEFKVKNTFDKDVKISKVAVGCTSCTKATIHNSIIKIGEEGTVFVEYTPGSTGFQNKSVSLGYSLVDTSSITPQKDILLRFKAYVE